jgi:hypothetical protein
VPITVRIGGSAREGSRPRDQLFAKSMTNPITRYNTPKIIDLVRGARGRAPSRARGGASFPVHSWLKVIGERKLGASNRTDLRKLFSLFTFRLPLFTSPARLALPFLL